MALEAIADEAQLSADDRIEFFFAWMIWRLESSPLAPALSVVFEEIKRIIPEAEYRSILRRAHAAMQSQT